jgi:drug/metabolite transporter (DMT)-like permease
MLFGVVLGKRYSIRKYVNVIIITAGVALFMGGGSSTSKGGGGDSTLIGALMLSISLCFDGLTGAYEDKLMSGDNQIGPYDLMFNIQFGKSFISFCILMTTNGQNEFINTVNTGGMNLVLLGLTGALGQVIRHFIRYTLISYHFYRYGSGLFVYNDIKIWRIKLCSSGIIQENVISCLVFHFVRTYLKCLSDSRLDLINRSYDCKFL